MKTNRKNSKNRKAKTLKGWNVQRTAHGRPLKRKARKVKVAEVEIDNGEAIAEQDFNNEVRLNGWKAINKTWTKGKIARFRATKYVKDLQVRIKDLQKKVVVFS